MSRSLPLDALWILPILWVFRGTDRVLADRPASRFCGHWCPIRPGFHHGEITAPTDADIVHVESWNAPRCRPPMRRSIIAADA